MAKTELSISYGGHSTAGLKQENQDAFAAYAPTGYALKHKGVSAVIADGVSASARSGEASQVSVTHFINDYYSTPDSWTTKESGGRILNSLNSWLFQQGIHGQSRYSDMVTTFSAIIFKSNTAHLFHIGDSALFRFRHNSLEPLSRAHSVVTKNQQAVLTRALGMDNHLEVDYQQTDIEVGDIFLLSTDGVHDFLSLNELQALIKESHKDLEDLSQRIISHALNKGSDDNLSCLLCKVDALPVEDIDEAHRNITAKKIPPVLKSGVSIDNYLVEKVLHSSTRSHLYLVKHKEDNTRLVLKAPSENFSDDAHYLESFIREQWIGQQVNHPNVMQVHPRANNSHFLYNVYEYIPAQDLRQWIIDNPSPNIGRVRGIIEQISSALRALQRKSMVHRDLKPENIMIDKDDCIKLIDFGTIQVNGLSEISNIIEEEAPVGSVNYIAPEYLMGQTGEYRSDIFSLGVIAYEMLCSELPYKPSLYKNHIPKHYSHWQYRDISEYRQDIPTWLNGALKKSCAANPKDRYMALSEFNHDLKTPNNQLHSKQNIPLIERNPVLFWQSLSLLFFISLVVQAILNH